MIDKNGIKEVLGFCIFLVFLFQRFFLQAQDILDYDIQRTQVYFVATNGNDDWTGKLPAPNASNADGPFATLDGARDVIREIKKAGLNEPVTVMLLEGKYYLPGTFKLSPEDSGTEDCPVTYTAYPGHKPVVLGGVKVTGWEPYKGKIWRCNLNEQGYTFTDVKQLVYDNEPQPLARYPNRDKNDPRNGGYLYLPLESIDNVKIDVNSNKGVLEYNENDWRTWQQAPTEEARGSKQILRYDPAKLNPAKWANPQKVEVNFLPYHNWVQQILSIKDIDTVNHTILLAEEAKYKLIRDTRFFIQNTIEELDSPGEWYLDHDKQILYFWPVDDNPNYGNVFIPNLDTIISIAGDAKQDKYVEYISFGGFDIQLCKELAISLSASKNCKIYRNTITNIQRHGITLDEDCKNNKVVGNDITRIGGGAIVVNGSENLASNNHVYNIGTVYKSYATAVLGTNNTLSHNLIHDVPTFAINFQGHNNIIEYNELHHYGLESTLSGGIYAISRHNPDGITGTAIRFNKITDAVGWGMYRPGEWGAYPCWGIWLDDHVSKTTVFGNILVRNVRGSVQLHGGENSLFENNIMVAGLPSTMNHIRKDGRPCYNKILRNIIYYTNPDPKMMQRYGQIVRGITGDPHSIAPLFFVGWAVPEVAAEESDYNLFCPIEGNQLNDLYFYKGVSNSLAGPWVKGPVPDRFSWWRKQGFEEHSITVNDPMFVDAENGDFRLKPGSPAFELGFKPIPLDKIGLYQSPDRASWPVINY